VLQTCSSLARRKLSIIRRMEIEMMLMLPFIVLTETKHGLRPYTRPTSTPPTSEGVNDGPTATKTKPQPFQQSRSLLSQSSCRLLPKLTRKGKFRHVMSRVGSTASRSKVHESLTSRVRHLLSVHKNSFCVASLMTNTPNSCPPERVFTMFNATFGEDQKRSFGD
jgi:hypothetical protein